MWIFLLNHHSQFFLFYSFLFHMLRQLKLASAKDNMVKYPLLFSPCLSSCLISFSIILSILFSGFTLNFLHLSHCEGSLDVYNSDSLCRCRTLLFFFRMDFKCDRFTFYYHAVSIAWLTAPLRHSTMSPTSLATFKSFFSSQLSSCSATTPFTHSFP